MKHAYLQLSAPLAGKVTIFRAAAAQAAPPTAKLVSHRLTVILAKRAIICDLIGCATVPAWLEPMLTTALFLVWSVPTIAILAIVLETALAVVQPISVC